MSDSEVMSDLEVMSDSEAGYDSQDSTQAGSFTQGLTELLAKVVSPPPTLESREQDATVVLNKGTNTSDTETYPVDEESCWRWKNDIRDSYNKKKFSDQETQTILTGWDTLHNQGGVAKPPSASLVVTYNTRPGTVEDAHESDRITTDGESSKNSGEDTHNCHMQSDGIESPVQRTDVMFGNVSPSSDEDESNEDSDNACDDARFEWSDDDSFKRSTTLFAPKKEMAYGSGDDLMSSGHESEYDEGGESGGKLAYDGDIDDHNTEVLQWKQEKRRRRESPKPLVGMKGRDTTFGFSLRYEGE